MTQTNYLAYKFKFLACVLGMVIVILNAACQNTNRPASNVQTSGETPSVVNPSSSASITFDVESVTLNYKTRNMEIRGKLRNNGTIKPEKVWVWAYCFAPNSEYASGSWSGSPIELNNPFASGDEPIVTASSHFHWWDNPNTPRSGYYARVSTSTQSEDTATVPSTQRNKSAAGAYTVRIVQ